MLHWSSWKSSMKVNIFPPDERAVWFWTSFRRLPAAGVEVSVDQLVPWLTVRILRLFILTKLLSGSWACSIPNFLAASKVMPCRQSHPFKEQVMLHWRAASTPGYLVVVVVNQSSYHIGFIEVQLLQLGGGVWGQINQLLLCHNFSKVFWFQVNVLQNEENQHSWFRQVSNYIPNEEALCEYFVKFQSIQKISRIYLVQANSNIIGRQKPLKVIPENVRIEENSYVFITIKT